MVFKKIAVGVKKRVRLRMAGDAWGPRVGMLECWVDGNLGVGSECEDAQAGVGSSQCSPPARLLLQLALWL